MSLNDKRLQFLERARVEQLFQTFARGQLAFGVLSGNAFFAAAQAGLGAHFAQCKDAGIFYGHRKFL